MPSPPAALFCALDAGTLSDGLPDAPVLESLRGGGIEALICPAPLWPDSAEEAALASLAERAGKAGLHLFIEADLARFPLDHELVGQMPEAFAIRRAHDGPHPVDPRTDLPATGQAIARFFMPSARMCFINKLCQRLADLARLGIAGCRLAAGSRIPPDLLADLVAAHPDLAFIAGPPGADRGGLVALGEAGCHYLVSSFAWWDLTAPWLVEEVAQLSRAASILHEIAGDAATPALRTRIEAAAALGDGLILPLRLAVEAVRAGGLPRPAEGHRSSRELRRLSGSASPITALLRPEADPREAGRAELILINTSEQEQALDHHPLPSAVGAEFTAAISAGSATHLAPGEVRRLTLHRARPILPEPPRAPAAARLAAMDRLVVEAISPSVEGGAFPVKRVVGDSVSVEATIYADGHEQLAAELLWRPLDSKTWNHLPMTPLANDRWRADFPLARLGRHEFAVEAWIDRFGGFRRDFATKVEAGVAQLVDHAEGRALIEAAIARLKGQKKEALRQVLAALGRASEEDSIRLLLSDEVASLMALADERPHCCRSPAQIVDAERIEARFSSWYEIFPRSITDDKARHGTFADVIGILPHVRDMGFDTLYFPPIHPIGRVNRKGPNNTLTPGPDDPGSPYAIGSREGGHDAIHPQLGTFEDFARLVEAAHEHGLEIALDFAIQCAPDHPWLTEHPGWFAWRPDGSMKYAENPPKKYQDIVNVDFYGPDAVPALWEALRDVVLLWVGHGVKTFRVDNPHTKPLPFWEWMIGEVRTRHPEVIFLSEAFTRPTMMYRLAKVGFSQSYTYFTWREGKQELIEYITELTTSAVREFYRPHFFVNTPDINPFYLQTSGRAGFRVRAALAATLSGLFGVYAGFELCEYEPLGPGKEEYLNSEKYEIRPRPLRRDGDIVDDIALLNRLRRAHPALQTHLNTRFYTAHNDAVIWYGKPSATAAEGAVLDEMIMVMINLDPHHGQDCAFEVPLWEFGLGDGAAIAVEDLVGSYRFDWHGKHQHIRIEPAEPYRIWRLSRGDRA